MEAAEAHSKDVERESDKQTAPSLPVEFAEKEADLTCTGGKLSYVRQQSCISVESLIAQTSATNSLGAAVLKLANGILDMYEPDVRHVEGRLSELTVKQDMLLSKITKQNQRFDDVKKEANLEEMASTTKLYLTKLSNMKKEMCGLQDRVARVKKRALKLQQSKEKEALQREHERERTLERERQMIAKPVKKK